MKKIVFYFPIFLGIFQFTYAQNTSHVLSENAGTNLNESNNYNGAVIKSYIPGKPLDKGASLSFVLSADSDKQNMWSLGRIMVLPASQNSYNADGKMILGTRRFFNKYGIGNAWYFGDDLTIDSQGNVGVGTKIPDSKLTVNGNIHAQEVKVDLQVPADYVFQQYYIGSSSLKEEYRFPTLEETEQFIKENHHLPQVPTAQQIQEQGLKVGEMTNLLLQKIEELTLYSIEQNKELQKQQEKITRLENLLLKN